MAIIEDPWHAPTYNYSLGPLTIDHPSPQPPNLQDGKVTPTSGFEGDHFNFTVKYFHLQNQMPKKVTLNLTAPYEVTYEMLESDVSDKNYEDGKIFYYNLSLSDGIYSYHFAAFDGVFWNETDEVTDSPIVATLPPNLSNGKVFPFSGLEITFFNFTVDYSDLHNDPAVAITLNLTGPSGGIFPMMEVDFGDTDTIDGKEYYFNSTLLAGIYSYHFAASNGIYWVETEKVFNSPIVTEGEPALFECKVIPSSGLAGENFNYTVTYFDPNNDLPAEILVNITGPSGGNFMMHEVNPDDTDCIDGKLYHLNLTLLKGIYSYHFAASDGTYWVETLEAINSPQVFNNIPSLSSFAVTPTTGFGGQYFNFTVIYSDADNDAPISIMVNITGPSGGNFIMMELSPNNQNFAEGKLYYYNTTLSTGTYSYHFSATDGLHWVETSEMPASLTVANNPPWIKITYPPESGVTVDDNLTITWIDLDPDDDAMISLYYDTDSLNHDGILIISNISEDDETDSYTWSTISIPNGTYYIYAMIHDEVNLLVYNYSVGFVIVEHPAEDQSDEEIQFASSTDPSFSLFMVAIIIAVILSLILLAFKRRRTAPEEKIIETEAEEEPEEPIAEAEELLTPKIEARLEKLEKELDKLLTEEVEPGEEGKEHVKEASIPEDMEEYIFICPRCVTLLKEDTDKCPGCGFSFDFEEDVE